MNTGIKINNHPFYQDSRFETEKKILEKLTEICRFDTSVGVVDYFPQSPIVEIGFLLDQCEEEKEKSVPILTSNSKISIVLNSYFPGGSNPIIIPEELTFKALSKIVIPLVSNWIEVATFLVNFYEGPFKDSCLQSLEEWKKES